MDTLSQSAMIDAAAHGSAFGNNTHPTPSDAQCKAGNYRVGRLQFHGLPICIEQPRDSVRSGIGPDGASWSCRMAAHYGYISGTKGTDGDAVDCFVGQLPTKNAYIINQFIGSRFDEHKVMLGFDRQESAVSAYLGSYSQGWQGLHSIIPASIEQLSWWLKFGNQSRPVIHDHLPGSAAMTQPPVLWANGLPTNATLDQVLYNMRRDDPDNLLIYPVSVSDILADAEGGTFDALVVQASKAEQKLGQLKMAMERAGGEIKPVAMQITEPFRQNGTTNVAAVIEMDDGQTVSVYLHNPDVTPSKLAPSDALISWRWMLNRRDITIVAAPENGDDLRPMEVAKRVMALVQKNSPAFKRANERRAANMQEIKSLNDEIGELEKRKAMLEHQISVREIEISSAPQSKGQYRISNSRKNVVVVTEKDGVLSVSVRNKGEKHDMTAKSTAEANAQIAALLGGAELSLSSGSDVLAGRLIAAPEKHDLSYRRSADGLFTTFLPNTPEGENAWRTMNATQNSDGGKVLASHTEAVIQQIRDAGYTVSEDASAPVTADEVDAMVADLTGAGQVDVPPAARNVMPDPVTQLLNKLASGYGYSAGVDSMPAGLMTTAKKLASAIISNDVKAAQDILHPSNKLSRKAFEFLFDGRVKLPKTVGGTDAVIKDFIDRVSDAAKTATQTEPAPAAAPTTDQYPPQAAADRALFQSIIDGTVPDLLSAELASEFEAAGERRENDPDMKVLFEKAVDVYQEAMLAATANLA